MTSTIEAVTLQ